MPIGDDAIGAQASCSVGFPRGIALVLLGGLIYLYLILFSPPLIPIYLASDGTISISQWTDRPIYPTPATPTPTQPRRGVILTMGQSKVQAD